MFIILTVSDGSKVRINPKYIVWYKDSTAHRKVYVADGSHDEPFLVKETMEELDSLIWLSSQPSVVQKSELEI